MERDFLSDISPRRTPPRPGSANESPKNEPPSIKKLMENQFFIPIVTAIVIVIVILGLIMYNSYTDRIKKKKRNETRKPSGKKKRKSKKTKMKSNATE